MTIYKLFFTDYAGKEVPSEHPKDAAKGQIIELMQEILNSPDNFLGIVDQKEQTLQFMVNDDQTILVDIPMPEMKGSYQKNVDLEGAVRLVKKLGNIIQLELIEGLVFEKW